MRATSSHHRLNSLFCSPVLGVFAVAAIALASAPSHAHKVGMSKVAITVDGDQVFTSVSMARSEVVSTWPTLDRNGDGTFDDAEFDAKAFATALGGVVTVTTDGNAPLCKARTLKLKPAADNDDGDTKNDAGNASAVVIEKALQCDSIETGAVAFSLPWLADVDSSHRAIVLSMGRDGARHQSVVTAKDPEVVLNPDAAHSHPKASAPAFFGLGIEHILIGADHLLFLFALVLLRARRRDLLLLVSAFTLAHSITLSASSLGWLALPGSIVEPIIALSVALVGVENLLTGRFAPDMSKRWRLTFLFGLVHGFGFAGVLAEIGLPQESTALALVLFNVGVEAGQLMVLALILPLLWVIRRKAPLSTWFDTYGVRILSAAVIVVGLFWLLERVL